MSFLAFRRTIFILRCGFLRTFAVIRIFFASTHSIFKCLLCLKAVFLLCLSNPTYKPLNHFDTLFFFDVSLSLYSVSVSFFFIVVENDERKNTNLFRFLHGYNWHIRLLEMYQWARWQMEKHFIKIYKWSLWMCYADCVDIM